MKNNQYVKNENKNSYNTIFFNSTQHCASRVCVPVRSRVCFASFVSGGNTAHRGRQPQPQAARCAGASYWSHRTWLMGGPRCDMGYHRTLSHVHLCTPWRYRGTGDIGDGGPGASPAAAAGAAAAGDGDGGPAAKADASPASRASPAQKRLDMEAANAHVIKPNTSRN